MTSRVQGSWQAGTRRLPDIPPLIIIPTSCRGARRFWPKLVRPYINDRMLLDRSLWPAENEEISEENLNLNTALRW